MGVTASNRRTRKRVVNVENSIPYCDHHRDLGQMNQTNHGVHLSRSTFSRQSELASKIFLAKFAF